MQLKKSIYITYLQDHIDIFVAIIGALFGIIVFCLNLIHSNAYTLTLGPLLYIVCLIYLLFRQKLLSPAADSGSKRNLVFTINIIFWFSLAASTYSLGTESLHRPLIYFILISIAASMIALQIFYCRDRNKISPYLILFEIMLISFSVRASAFWVFPSIPGSDPWAHLIYIQDFVDLGKIGSIHGNVYYNNFPMMHLIVVATKLITNLDYKSAMFIGAGLPLMISVIFVYLIGRNLVNTKVGLFATLFISLADFHLQFGIQIIAMTIGIVLFTMIAYLLIACQANNRKTIRAIVLLLMFVLILTHTVSAFVMFCFILFLFIGMRAYRFINGSEMDYEKSMLSYILTYKMVILYGVGILVYWGFAGYTENMSVLKMIADGLYTSITAEAGLMARPQETTGIHQLLSIWGLLIWVFFTILGCLLCLSRIYRNQTKFSLIVALILLLVVTFSFPLMGIRNILPFRWFCFIYVVLCFFISVSVISIVPRGYYHKIGIIGLMLGVFITSFFMITDDISNMDSPVYAEDLTQRLVYTRSEIAVAEKVIDVYDGLITTDQQYGQNVLGAYMGRANLSYNMLNVSTLATNLVIWRDIMLERPVQTTDETLVLEPGYEQMLENYYNLIYINNTSKAFLTRGQ